MARLIEFSRRSTAQLQKILTFYDERNGSDVYSRRLLRELMVALHLSYGFHCYFPLQHAKGNAAKHSLISTKAPLCLSEEVNLFLLALTRKAISIIHYNNLPFVAKFLGEFLWIFCMNRDDSLGL